MDFMIPKPKNYNQISFIIVCPNLLTSFRPVSNERKSETPIKKSNNRAGNWTCLIRPQVKLQLLQRSGER